ncbi:37S ribosomal protein S24, mitochondrial [Coniothyrium glycines]
MASTTRRLLLQSRQCPTRIRAPRQTPQWQRPLSTTTVRCAKEPAKDGSTPPPKAQAADTTAAQKPPKLTPGQHEERRKRAEEQREALMLADIQAQLAELDPEVVREAIDKGRRGIPFATDIDLDSDEDLEIEPEDTRKASLGFWAEGEDSSEMEPDEDYYGDDITSLGHGELQKHRNLRAYARLIAWELPLLSHLAQPFEPPTHSTPFRFRYTSYLGESHPAANKVVVEFSPTDLSLTAPQVTKMLKLAGPRYNPSTGIVKMSCETHSTQAQNKRFLGERIAALIAAAQDPADMFDDVPLDLRHHKQKKFVHFPKEWVLTPERKQYLAHKRAAAAQVEDRKVNNGELVDGQKVIETSLPFLGQERDEELMAEAPRSR